MTGELVPKRDDAVIIMSANMLTIVGEISFQQIDAQPECLATSSFSRNLKSSEFPYIRPAYRLNQEWRDLDLGYCAKEEKLSLIVVSNKRTVFHFIPTEDVAAAEKRRIVEIGRNGEALMEVPVGEAMPFTPALAQGWQLRCREGEAEVKIVVVSA